MEALIFFVWFLLVIVIFLGLIVTAYVAFIRGKNLMFVVPKFLLSLVGYVVLTYLMMWPMFLMIYGGAHTEPVGNALSATGRLMMAGLVLLYVIAGWLLCSFVYGRLIGKRYDPSEIDRNPG